jgi:hypothetical protein
MKYWEIIADNLSKAGFSWGCVLTITSSGQTSLWWTSTAMTESASFVRSDEKLSAFVELEREVLTLTFYLESIHADRGTDQ